MNVARILYPVRALGPGSRIGIWFSGCPHHCPGCSNPELWIPRLEHATSPDQLITLIIEVARVNTVDGFTLTGGEPFAQPEALAEVLPLLSRVSEDILVYSGYTLEELCGMQDDHVKRSLGQIAVLVDGRYEENHNTGCKLRGSENQQILVLKAQFADQYRRYLQEDSGIQTFMQENSAISVGIHRPGYMDILSLYAQKKGLTEDGE